MVASGSLDTTIIIWSMAHPDKHTIIKSESLNFLPNYGRAFTDGLSTFADAHPQSQITRLVWLDNETVISSGQDCNTKVWQVEKI